MMDKGKYFYLLYHEFLEYIARISIEAFRIEDRGVEKGMDHSVFHML